MDGNNRYNSILIKTSEIEKLAFFLAYNFHDGENEHLALINVHAGSDALSAFWHDLGSETPLYASHADFLKRVADIHNGHW